VVFALMAGNGAGLYYLEQTNKRAEVLQTEIEWLSARQSITENIQDTDAMMICRLALKD